MPSSTVKWCCHCEQTKPVAQFSKPKPGKARTPDGYSSWCKDCTRNYCREWTLRDPVRARYGARRSRLRNNYGLTLSAERALLAAQQGLCAICGRPDGGSQNAQSDRVAAHELDVDHTTGEVRGLLCGLCNRALGAFNDSPEKLRKAAAYLENPSYAQLCANRRDDYIVVPLRSYQQTALDTQSAFLPESAENNRARQVLGLDSSDPS